MATILFIDSDPGTVEAIGSSHLVKFGQLLAAEAGGCDFHRMRRISSSAIANDEAGEQIRVWG